MRVRTLAVAIAMAGSLPGALATAQYMPHLDPNLYMFAVMNMSGRQCLEVTDKKLNEVRGPTRAAMVAYFASAGGAGTKSAAFKNSGKTKWRAGTTTATFADIDRATDPLATGGNTLDGNALRFYRAGNLSTALGQWAVKARDGTVAGVYTGLFERESHVWKLRDLTVHRADELVEPVAPYCAKPGDTTQQRVTTTADFVTRNEKQLAKRQAALAAAQAGPDPALVKREREKLAKAEEALAKSRENHAEAVADAAEIKRLTLPAREAERLRKVEPAKAG